MGSTQLRTMRISRREEEICEVRQNTENRTDDWI